LVWKFPHYRYTTHIHIIVGVMEKNGVLRINGLLRLGYKYISDVQIRKSDDYLAGKVSRMPQQPPYEQIIHCH
jgi:hypothetical protein